MKKRQSKRFAWFASLLAMPLLVIGLGVGGGKGAPAISAHAAKQVTIPIQHVVIIMQENRSFDTYFGTYPGAEGIPRNANGVPTVCVNDPRTGQCVKPFHDSADINTGGGHANPDFITDVDNGKMDGFLSADTTQHPNPKLLEVMGYHDQREIPNYWAYAKNFVLQDHMFEPVASWSSPCHLYLVSEWSASCTVASDPSTCVNDISTGISPNNRAWTDMTWLMYHHNPQVTWGYYITTGNSPDSDDGSANYVAHHQDAMTPSIWNPLATFYTVTVLDNQAGNIQPLGNFYSAIKNGTLPQVSWIIPDQVHSEHPLAKISDGQAHVTQAINAIMNSSYWTNTAIFLAWDDWGGFYDHFNPLPEMVDINGYGIRVPGLVISAYARKGYIDKQILSFDAYNKFIEALFLNGQALDPNTDGRPDPRIIPIRETQPILGNLMNDFDFTQAPLPPLILPPYPRRR